MIDVRLNIGEKIRELRRERQLTQEELAEHLGVSFQAVSRWETGGCYPDMELLPVLGAFFGVTVDCLLGVDDGEETRRIRKYLEDFQLALSRGDIRRCISTARAGTAEFPGSWDLADRLMYALFLAGDDDGSIPEWKENREALDGELTALGERIIRCCPEQEVRLEAAARLAAHYCDTGRRTQGRRLCETLPPAGKCRELRMLPALEPEEKLDHARKLNGLGREFLLTGMYLMTNEGLLNDGDTLAVLEKRERLEALLYDERPSDWGTADHHCRKAAVLVRLRREEEALRELGEAVRAAEEFDGRPEEALASGLLTGEVTLRRTDFETADARPLRTILRDKWLAKADFDPLREREAFKALTASLS